MFINSKIISVIQTRHHKTWCTRYIDSGWFET